MARQDEAGSVTLVARRRAGVAIRRLPAALGRWLRAGATAVRGQDRACTLAPDRAAPCRM